jgi:plastocyanin
MVQSYARFVWIAGIALVLGGCSHPTSPQMASSVASQPTKSVDAATAGVISGSVDFNGPAPDLKPIDMSAAPPCKASHSGPVMPQQLVVGDHGALANAVVYVKSGLTGYRFDVPTVPVTVEQKGCMYEPHVAALMAGQALVVQNDDPTIHNVHAMARENREWNRSEAPGTGDIREVFDRPEVAIPLKCNVHPWMRGYVAVFDNPYFAVTSPNGAFTLRSVPPGTYTIEAWHEKLGDVDQIVTIGPKESKQIVLTFSSPSAAD